jgi:MarR family transcriptional regulator, lower aerobic nicotinate degradation pathway regulator
MLLASTGFLLARLGMESRRRFSRLMSRYELSMHHYGLLMALGDDGGIPQNHLSRMLGVDARNAVPIIDELEKRKLIVRTPDSSDRRRYNITLTSSGRRLIRDVRQEGAELERDMLKSLTRAEQPLLHSLLLRVFQDVEDTPDAP